MAASAAGGRGVGVGWGISNAFRHPTTVQSPIAIASPTTVQNNGNRDANAIAAKVNPAIVDINTVTTSGNASGTGQILTPDGEVLTNNHVVDGSTSISVVIAGRSGTFTAHVIAVDPAKRVAMMQSAVVYGLPTTTTPPPAGVPRPRAVCRVWFIRQAGALFRLPAGEFDVRVEMLPPRHDVLNDLAALGPLRLVPVHP